MHSYLNSSIISKGEWKSQILPQPKTTPGGCRSGTLPAVLVLGHDGADAVRARVRVGHSLVCEQGGGVGPRGLEVLHGVPLADAALLREPMQLVV